MKISQDAWKSYIDQLSKINKKAAEKVADYFRAHPDIDIEDLISYAYNVANYYGEAAGELACEMYDEVASVAPRVIPAAESAATATYGEVAQAIQGAMLRTNDPDAIGAVVGNKVKTVGLDSLINNSMRDGAEFAWIPSGDTCAFCIMLASNGWQRASKKALKHGHASHVHNNCDCTYAIRFDHDTEVEGYDPDYYKDLYDNAEGQNWKDKVNYIRRKQREDPTVRERINAQKRSVYDRNRRIKYGERDDIDTDGGIVQARKVDKYGYNNIYVDEKITLTERQLRSINKQISEAKEALGIVENCDVKVIITKLDKKIASYNPVRNYMLISERLTAEKELLKAQIGYASAEDRRSTAVHELFHWKDAFDYRKITGEIFSSGPNSEYTIYQRARCLEALKKAGVDIYDVMGIKSSISEYAYLSALDNDWEEVYTEFRTKELLK